MGGYKIRIHKKQPYEEAQIPEPWELRQEIEDAIDALGMTAEVRSEGQGTRSKFSYIVSLHTVRLKTARSYCGNHPAACENPGERPRKAKYLEGGDWAKVNDAVNTVLDRRWLSAYVDSRDCEIRDGTLRRIGYDCHTISFIGRELPAWDREGVPNDYADYCGNPEEAPASTVPFGTPGATPEQVGEAA